MHCNSSECWFPSPLSRASFCSCLLVYFFGDLAVVTKVLGRTFAHSNGNPAVKGMSSLRAVMVPVSKVWACAQRLWCQSLGCGYSHQGSGSGVWSADAYRVAAEMISRVCVQWCQDWVWGGVDDSSPGREQQWLPLWGECSFVNCSQRWQRLKEFSVAKPVRIHGDEEEVCRYSPALLFPMGRGPCWRGPSYCWAMPDWGIGWPS